MKTWHFVVVVLVLSAIAIGYSLVDRPEMQGVTNFDSLTLSDDLIVGDDASIGDDLTVTGVVTPGDISMSDLTITSSITSADLVVTDDLSVGDVLSADSITVTTVLSATEFWLTSPVYDDMRIAATSLRLPPAGIDDPDFAVLVGNTYTYRFDKTTEESLFFLMQMPHTWAEGTAIEPHVHWAPIDTDVGSVVWELDCAKANVNSVITSTSVITVADAGDGTAFKHQIAGLSSMDMTGNLLSVMLACKLSRLPGDPSDDYNNDAALLEIDFHYEIDTLGSRQEYVK